MARGELVARAAPPLPDGARDPPLPDGVVVFRWAPLEPELLAPEDAEPLLEPDAPDPLPEPDVDELLLAEDLVDRLREEDPPPEASFRLTTPAPLTRAAPTADTAPTTPAALPARDPFEDFDFPPEREADFAELERAEDVERFAPPDLVALERDAAPVRDDFAPEEAERADELRAAVPVFFAPARLREAGAAFFDPAAAERGRAFAALFFAGAALFRALDLGAALRLEVDAFDALLEAVARFAAGFFAPVFAPAVERRAVLPDDFFAGLFFADALADLLRLAAGFFAAAELLFFVVAIITPLCST